MTSAICEKDLTIAQNTRMPVLTGAKKLSQNKIVYMYMGDES